MFTFTKFVYIFCLLLLSLFTFFVYFYKGIEKERDDMKRKIKEFEAKMEVLTRSEQAMNKDANERLKQLEKALEEALIGKKICL